MKTIEDSLTPAGAAKTGRVRETDCLESGGRQKQEG